MNKKIGHDHQEEIEKIMGSMECPNDFKCLETGQCLNCKLKGFNLETAVEVDGKDRLCQFISSYGDTYYCHCPLKVYLAKNSAKRKHALL